MSPTPSWRSAVRRLLSFTDHQGGHVFAQLSIPVRTSHLRPCLRKWMRDKVSEGWLHRCICRRQKQVQQLQEFITPLEKSSMSSSAHFRSAERLVATHSHQRKSSTDPRRVQETKSARDRIRTDRQEVRDHLRFREDEAAEGEDVALSRLSGAEHQTRLLFEGQRNQILSEARSEVYMQELRPENADIPRESNRQIHSHRMEPYRTNHIYENSRRAQAWLQAELENRERAQQETCFGTLQEVEELKMFCSTQAESYSSIKSG